jgi:hypothetical protein
VWLGQWVAVALLDAAVFARLGAEQAASVLLDEQVDGELSVGSMDENAQVET